MSQGLPRQAAQLQRQLRVFAANSPHVQLELLQLGGLRWLAESATPEALYGLGTTSQRLKQAVDHTLATPIPVPSEPTITRLQAEQGCVIILARDGSIADYWASPQIQPQTVTDTLRKALRRRIISIIGARPTLPSRIERLLPQEPPFQLPPWPLSRVMLAHGFTLEPQYLYTFGIFLGLEVTDAEDDLAHFSAILAEAHIRYWLEHFRLSAESSLRSMP